MRLTEVTLEKGTVQLQLTATAPTAVCPHCAVPSSAVHSRYQRRLTDLPWGTRAVRIQLMVRKFVCRQPSCTRRIFTERLPDIVAPSARKTTRLIAVLRAIGVALGGQAGARLAARLWLSTRAATLLLLVRAAPVPRPPALQAIDIDEWGWRRGHRYGTILVNLADHRVVDKTGQTIDFLLTAQRNEQAATHFLTKAIRCHAVPETITIDGSEASAATIRSYNAAHRTALMIRQVRYLNNVVEQDHRAVKRVARPILGFKSFATAQGTLVGIELMHMLKKGQIGVEEGGEGLTPAEQFYALAA